MNDLLEFLTSEEIIIVYIIAALACLICFVVYLVEKNNEKLRRKHNTKELNKLVEEIKATLPEEENKIIYDEPILETIEEKEETSINELLQEPILIGPIEVKEQSAPVVIEQLEDYEESTPEPVEEELQYTSIEPDQETARLELKKLQEQLEKEENIEPVDVVTNYENEQERTAIISME